MNEQVSACDSASHPLSSLRRRLLVAAPAFGAAAVLAPVARAQKIPKAGVDYRVIQPPQPTAQQDKIEVTEFFWYGCPHCAQFQPHMERWIKTMPADVYLRRVPVAFDPSREPHSRIFYTLEALGQIDKLHQKMFQVIVVERQPLLKPDEIADFMAKNGIDRKKWLDTYNSFGVMTRSQAARRIVEAYKIDGTPALGVAGRFETSPAQARGANEALQVVDYLVAQVRKGAAG